MEIVTFSRIYGLHGLHNMALTMIILSSTSSKLSIFMVMIGVLDDHVKKRWLLNGLRYILDYPISLTESQWRFWFLLTTEMWIWDQLNFDIPVCNLIYNGRYYQNNLWMYEIYTTTYVNWITTYFLPDTLTSVGSLTSRKCPTQSWPFLFRPQLDKFPDVWRQMVYVPPHTTCNTSTAIINIPFFIIQL